MFFNSGIGSRPSQMAPCKMKERIMQVKECIEALNEYKIVIDTLEEFASASAYCDAIVKNHLKVPRHASKTFY